MFFKNIIKGVLIAVIFTIICLTIFSILLVNTNISESLIQPVIIGITGISILLSSSIANKKMNKNGIINGAVIGFIYVFLIYIISSFFNGCNFSVNLGAISMIIIGILGGAIGGIIGVNIG